MVRCSIYRSPLPGPSLIPSAPMSAVLPFVFACGAAIGLFMAVVHFRGKKSPAAIGWLHGVFTLGGIAILTWFVLTMPDPPPDDTTSALHPSTGWLLLGLFGLAALGGAFLYRKQQRDEPWPAFVILAHGGTALVALTLLIVWLL